MSQKNIMHALLYNEFQHRWHCECGVEISPGPVEDYQPEDISISVAHRCHVRKVLGLDSIKFGQNRPPGDRC